MGLCLSTTSRLQSTGRIGQGTICGVFQRQSPHVISIHMLDDDSLLNIFYLYRPFFLGEDEKGIKRIEGGSGLWSRGRWWYRLVHVCQRWRNLILGSASYLGLSLVCTNGTPVQNMLAHSPPLPLTIQYCSDDSITAEEEEGLLLALEQRHRVRHLCLVFPAQNLQKLVMAIDEEFPILEYLIVIHSTFPMGDGIALMLPETLQAPNLHLLALGFFTCPIQPRLHPIAASLVTLCLVIKDQSAYFPPNILLQWVSFMPQLEILAIHFRFPVPNRDVERQLTHAPIMTRITLPVLRLFWFRGVSAYLEAFVCRITTPCLEDLRIQLFKQLTFSVPRLAQFMNTTENLRFDRAMIVFEDKQIHVSMSSREADGHTFIAAVHCGHLDWQVSSMTQISNSLSPVFSAVDHLTLRQGVHGQSSEEHNDVDRIEWRNFLRPFSNVKTLYINDVLVKELSRCLRLKDGELPLELLPKLEDLAYFGSRGAFTPFINARRDAGCPVTLLRLGPAGQGPSS